MFPMCFLVLYVTLSEVCGNVTECSCTKLFILNFYLHVFSYLLWFFFPYSAWQVITYLSIITCYCSFIFSSCPFGSPIPYLHPFSPNPFDFWRVIYSLSVLIFLGMLKFWTIVLKLFISSFPILIPKTFIFSILLYLPILRLLFWN